MTKIIISSAYTYTTMQLLVELCKTEVSQRKLKAKVELINLLVALLAHQLIVQFIQLHEEGGEPCEKSNVGATHVIGQSTQSYVHGGECHHFVSIRHHVFPNRFSNVLWDVDKLWFS